MEGHRRSKNKGKWNDVMAPDGEVSVITKQVEGHSVIQHDSCMYVRYSSHSGMRLEGSSGRASCKSVVIAKKGNIVYVRSKGS